MPEIRPFRALRYDAESVGDLAAVVAPPYDVIDAEARARLIARHPKNVVRLDFPPEEPGDEPDDRYRRAARTLAAWRSDGTFHKDPRPALYAYEQTYTVPGTETERTQRGFFGRLCLESYGTESGVRPHERTFEAPREDRYRLLRATGVNTSPVVALYDDPSGSSSAILATTAAGAPVIDIRDEDGVRHRLWVMTSDGDPASHVAGLIGAASAGAVTIADGHHRYETALRYRDERRMTRSCEEDPAYDYLLVLFLETTAEPLTVLPTHRIVRGLGPEGLTRLKTGLPELFDVRPAGRAELERTFGDGLSQGGAGRLGLWTRDGGSLLSARPDAFAAAGPSVPDAIRRLDVWTLGVALQHVLDIDDAAVASGERIGYSKSAAAAARAVDAGDDGADAAFLLEPTPVGSIAEVAASGAVMPQKSTYFYPKALTGLVINPLEW